jgi:hypothetical protein
MAFLETQKMSALLLIIHKIQMSAQSITKSPWLSLLFCKLSLMFIVSMVTETRSPCQLAGSRREDGREVGRGGPDSEPTRQAVRKIRNTRNVVPSSHWAHRPTSLWWHDARWGHLQVKRSNKISAGQGGQNNIQHLDLVEGYHSLTLDLISDFRRIIQLIIATFLPPKEVDHCLSFKLFVINLINYYPVNYEKQLQTCKS